MKKLNLNLSISKNDNIILIDGKYLIYRSQYSRGMSELSFEGIKTGIYFGFFNTIKSMLKKFNPVNVLIFWDSENSIRKKEYSEYKNKKNKYLTDKQIEILKLIKSEYPNFLELCEFINIKSYLINEYEADDLIALFTKKFKNINKVIISRDEDLYQLLDETTSLYSPDDKVLKNLKWFKSKYQIEPYQWAEVKQLSGCTSDNVPGIKGIGEKTAIKIIKGLEIANKKLENANKEELKLWGKLTKLPHHTIEKHNLPYKITKLNKDNFLQMCQMFNFRSFLENLNEFDCLF